MISDLEDDSGVGLARKRGLEVVAESAHGGRALVWARHFGLPRGLGCEHANSDEDRARGHDPNAAPRTSGVVLSDSRLRGDADGQPRDESHR